jgi:nitrogen fixation NifU-like protein
VYSQAVQDHFHNPRNVGPLEGATHTGTAGTPGEGPYVVLWLLVENGRIVRAAYRTYGCPAAVACASVVAELAAGRSAAEGLALTEAEVTAALGGLPEGKAHCPELAVRALRAALGR